MSEHILKLLRRFEKLPDTEEKQAISNLYINDEIGVFELCDKIRDYIETLNHPQEAIECEECEGEGQRAFAINCPEFTPCVDCNGTGRIKL